MSGHDAHHGPARADHAGAVGADQAHPASVPVAAKVTLDFQHVLDEVGGGLGAFAGRCRRLGLMGHTARLDNVSRVLAALDEVLV